VEVENCLGEHPAVAECAVIGVEEAGLAQTRACVVLRPGQTLSADLGAELQDFVRARLAPHKAPRQVIFVDDLPKTASGKLDRKALKQEAAGRAPV